MRVTPSFSTGTWPRTVMTLPERTPTSARAFGHAQWPCLPVRKMRKFSQIAIRMIAPGDDRREERRDVREDETVADHGHGESAEQRPGHGAAAAEEAGAAEDDGGDHVELETRAGIGRAAAEPRRDDDAGERRGGAADHIDRQDDAARIDAGAPYRLGIGADAR